VRVRTGLRHDLGREPTDEESINALENGAYKGISIDLIKEAFALGYEVSSIIFR
jgi:hypothetical protein